MEIYCLLIRHGITQGNIEKRYIGAKTNEPLCKEKIPVLLEAKKAMEENEKLVGLRLWDKVYVSPMLRCKQTAEILFPSNEQRIVEDLREIDFGDFENKNYEELKEKESYQSWLASGGRMAFLNGEAREDFIARSYRAFAMALKQTLEDCLTLQPKDVAQTVVPFVIHGGNIMAILSQLTGADYYDYQLACTEAYLIRCAIGEEQIDVISYDRISKRSAT